MINFSKNLFDKFFINYQSMVSTKYRLLGLSGLRCATSVPRGATLIQRNPADGSIYKGIPCIYNAFIQEIMEFTENFDFWKNARVNFSIMRNFFKNPFGTSFINCQSMVSTKYRLLEPSGLRCATSAPRRATLTQRNPADSSIYKGIPCNPLYFQYFIKEMVEFTEIFWFFFKWESKFLDNEKRI